MTRSAEHVYTPSELNLEVKGTIDSPWSQPHSLSTRSRISFGGMETSLFELSGPDLVATDSDMPISVHIDDALRASGPEGRLGQNDIAPAKASLEQAVARIAASRRPAVIMGYGYRTPSSGAAGAVAPLADPATGDLTTSVAAALRRAFRVRVRRRGSGPGRRTPWNRSRKSGTIPCSA